MLTPEIVAEYFPKAVQWVSEMENAVLESGQRLPPEYQKDAAAIGIRKIEDVRVIVLDTIPLPDDPGLKQLAVQTGLISDATLGMTFGHGIVLKKDRDDRRLIAHELTHVMQYERFGGIEAFLHEYVKEVAFSPGYPYGPLEREAAQMADRICQNP